MQIAKTPKGGKPGKLLKNEFDGFNDPPKKGSGLRVSSELQTPKSIISKSADNFGAVQSVPNFDDPQTVFIDPVVTDPLGLRASIDATGTTTYSNAQQTITSTLPGSSELDGPQNLTQEDSNFLKAIRNQEITIFVVGLLVVAALFYLLFKKP